MRIFVRPESGSRGLRNNGVGIHPPGSIEPERPDVPGTPTPAEPSNWPAKFDEEVPIAIPPSPDLISLVIAPSLLERYSLN
jgi:hypothetical protein